MKTSQAISDKLIINGIEIERFNVGIKDKVDTILGKAQKEIIAELAANDPFDPSLTQWREDRFNDIKAKIADVLKASYGEIEKETGKAAKDIAEYGLKTTPSLLNGILGVDLFAVNYTPEYLKNLVTNTMIEGHVIKDWWNKQSEDLQSKMIENINRIAQELQIGALKGEAIGELINRIRGTALKPGIMSLPKYQAAALARTSNMQVLQATRMEVYKQNEDVLKGYQVVATLDKRTTPICRALDGCEYDLNFKPIGHSRTILPGPPFHWNCRSTLIPITKSYAELAGENSPLSPETLNKLPSIPQTVRASMGGPVDADMNYNDWLLTQPEEIQKDILGPKRWQLWKDNKLTMSDLVHQDGRPLTLAELYERVNMPLPMAEPEIAVGTAVGDLVDRTFDGVRAKLAEFGMTSVVIPAQNFEKVLTIVDDLIRVAKENPALVDILKSRQLNLLEFVNAKTVPIVDNATGAYSIFKKELYTSLKYGVKDAMPKKGAYSSGNSVQSIFRHELGHHTKSAIVGSQESVNWNNLFLKYASDLPKKVTKYAGASTEEAFAECFAIYTCPTYKKGFLPDEIESFFENLLKNGTTKKIKGTAEPAPIKPILKQETPIKTFTKGMTVTEYTLEPGPQYGMKVEGIGEPEKFKEAHFSAKDAHGNIIQKWKSAGAIIVDEDGSVWIYKPKDAYAGYKATFPKGTIETGLTAQKTAIKEVFEETGFNVEIVGYLGDYEKTSSVTRYYIAKIKGGSPIGYASDETEAVLKVPQSLLKDTLNMKIDKKIADDFLVRYQEFINLGEGDIVKGAKIWGKQAADKAAQEEFSNLASSEMGSKLLTSKPNVLTALQKEADAITKLEKLKSEIAGLTQSEEAWHLKWTQFTEQHSVEWMNFITHNDPAINEAIQNLPTWESKYKYSISEYEKAMKNRAKLGGEGKVYDLTDPAQKAQYEKTKYMYLNKYKNAIIAGEQPTAAQKALWETLTPEEKELWQLKIDKGMGKLVQSEIKTIGEFQFDMGIPDQKSAYDIVYAEKDKTFKALLEQSNVKAMFNANPEYIPEVVGETDIAKKINIVTEKMKLFNAEQTKWNNKIVEFLNEEKNSKALNGINLNEALNKIPVARDQYKYLEKLVADMEELHKPNIVELGGKKQYNLSIPEEKAQYEKVKYMYLNKYKNAVITGQSPTPAQKALWDSLPAQEKELWQAKIDKALGKVGETPQPKAPEVQPPPEVKVIPKAQLKAQIEAMTEQDALDKLQEMNTALKDAGFQGFGIRDQMVHDAQFYYEGSFKKWLTELTDLLEGDSDIHKQKYKLFSDLMGGKPTVATAAKDLTEEEAKYVIHKFWRETMGNPITEGMERQNLDSDLVQGSYKKWLASFENDFSGDKAANLKKIIAESKGKAPAAEKKTIREMFAAMDEESALNVLRGIKFSVDDESIDYVMDVDEGVSYFGSAKKYLNKIIKEAKEFDMDYGDPWLQRTLQSYMRHYYDVMSNPVPDTSLEATIIRTTEPAKTLNFNNMVKYADQKGSNQGAFYHDKDNPAERYYIKFPANADIARNELLASKLYQVAGAEVPELQLIEVNGRQGIASRIVEGDLKKLDIEAFKKGMVKGCGDNFVVDAWLGDWDVVGLNYDNLLQVNGRAVRIDVGGSLRYRAQGGNKGMEFGKEVHELESMLDGRKNKQSAAVFKNVKKGDLEIGARKVLSISDDTIRQLVRDFGPTDKAEADNLAEILIARKQDIAKRFPHIKVEELSAPIEKPKFTVITKADQTNIVNSRAGGYSIKIDKEEIEDHNALFWTERTPDNKPMTGVNFKARGEAVRKLDDRVASKISDATTTAPKPGVYVTSQTHTDAVTCIKGIFSHADDSGMVTLRAVDIQRADEAIKTYRTNLIKMNDLRVAGQISDADFNGYKKHYEEWIDFFKSVQPKSEGNRIQIPAELRGKTLKKYKDINLIVKETPKPVEAPVEEFKFTKKGNQYDDKEIVRGHLKQTGGGTSFTDQFYEGKMPDGTRVRYWGANASYANKGKVEILVPGEGVDATAKVLEVMKKLGIETAHTDLDDEALYLRQLLYHMGKNPETMVGVGDSPEQVVVKLRAAFEKASGRKISNLREYDYLGTKEAFGQGNVLRWRPDLAENPHFARFRQEYALTHNMYGDTVNTIDNILNSGGKLLATTNKLRVGIYPSGMSPSADMGTGGASYVFTRIKTISNAKDYGGHLVWDSDLLRRLDSISYAGDKYGRTTEGFVQQNRKTGIDKWKSIANNSSNETIFKNSISIFDRLKYIVVNSKSEQTKVIQVFNKHGYTKFPDGRELKDVIVIARE